MKRKKELKIARGVSAPPSWWEEVDDAADDAGLDRSSFIRVVMNNYLRKDVGKTGSKTSNLLPV